jgi:carbamoylphosphate synthase large subunit
MLAALVERQHADLVIPTVSEELVPLARQQDPRVVVGPAEAVAVADDKWLTYLRLFDVGIAVPRSCLGGEGLSGVEVISKPRVGRGGRGFVIHRDGPPHLDRSRIVQELVPGTEYVVNLYLTDDASHDATNDVVDVLEKTEDGIHRTRAPDVAALAWSAAAAVGLRGPVDIDVRRRADGRPVVLDVNARFGAHSAHTPAVLDRLLAEHAC